MAQTTNALNGTDLGIWVESIAGGPMVSIRGTSNAVDLSPSREIGDYRTFQDSYTPRIGSKIRDVTGSVNVVYTPGDTEALRILEAAYLDDLNPRRFFFDMPNSEPGSKRYSGWFFITSMPLAFASDDANPVMVQFDLSLDGKQGFNIDIID